MKSKLFVSLFIDNVKPAEEKNFFTIVIKVIKN